MPPFYKAVSAFFLFAVLGIVGTLIAERPLFPLVLYYAILVLNTFVSIRTFAAITPKNAPQNIFDLILALTYAALAFTVDSVLRFSLLSTALFVVAALKYIHLRSLIVIERRLIARKIVLNSLGAGLSALAFIITLWGSANVAAWTLSLTFTLANVYLLFVRPMYRLDQEDNGV